MKTGALTRESCSTRDGSGLAPSVRARRLVMRRLRRDIRTLHSTTYGTSGQQPGNLLRTRSRLGQPVPPLSPGGCSGADGRGGHDRRAAMVGGKPCKRSCKWADRAGASPAAVPCPCRPQFVSSARTGGTSDAGGRVGRPMRTSVCCWNSTRPGPEEIRSCEAVGFWGRSAPL